MEKKNLISDLKKSITAIFRRGKSRSLLKPKLFAPQKLPYGSFKFNIKLASGCVYQILASPNLINWTTVATEKAAGEQVEFIDSEASKYNYRFYRILTEEFDSENIIGYVTISLPPGYAMIANPFKAENNTVATLFSELPEGTTFNKFDNHLFKLSENYLHNGRWSKANETFNPGEGGIIYNPTDDYRPLSFCGEVLQGQLNNPIPAGFSIKSSMLPKAGRLNDDLQFPIDEGDIVHLFDKDKQKYNVYPYEPKQWSSSPPIIGIGESFWVGKKSPANWVQKFLIEKL